MTMFLFADYAQVQFAVQQMICCLLVCVVIVSSFGMYLCYFTRLSHLPSSINLFWYTVSGVSPSTRLWASVLMFPGCSENYCLALSSHFQLVYKLRCLYVRVISLIPDDDRLHFDVRCSSIPIYLYIPSLWKRNLSMQHGQLYVA